MAINRPRSTPEKVLWALGAFMAMAVVTAWRQWRRREDLEWIVAPSALGHSMEGIPAMPLKAEMRCLIRREPQTWEVTEIVGGSQPGHPSSLWRVGWVDPGGWPLFAVSETEVPRELWLAQPQQKWARLARKP